MWLREADDECSAELWKLRPAGTLPAVPSRPCICPWSTSSSVRRVATAVYPAEFSRLFLPE
jgi:hypothetical protein